MGNCDLASGSAVNLTFSGTSKRSRTYSTIFAGLAGSEAAGAREFCGRLVSPPSVLAPMRSRQTLHVKKPVRGEEYAMENSFVTVVRGQLPVAHCPWRGA